MKITTEQLRALQENEARRTQQPQAAGDFSDLLTRQLGSDSSAPALDAAGLDRPLAPPAVLSPNLVQLSADAEATALSEEAGTRMESMFDTLENYAGEMARNDGADMRSAYATLQQMSSQIAEFKDRFPNAATEQPEMSSMLNELDVLTTTEIFKFNRGDYL